MAVLKHICETLQYACGVLHPTDGYVCCNDPKIQFTPTLKDWFFPSGVSNKHCHMLSNLSNLLIKELE